MLKVCSGYGPYTLHPTPCTLHPAPPTLKTSTYSLHPTPSTPSTCSSLFSCRAFSATYLQNIPDGCTINLVWKSGRSNVNTVLVQD